MYGSTMYYDPGEVLAYFHNQENHQRFLIPENDTQVLKIEQVNKIQNQMLHSSINKPLITVIRGLMSAHYKGQKNRVCSHL